MSDGLLFDFARELRQERIPQRLRDGLIGEDAVIEGPFGPKPLIYADYVASGRALAQVEDFVRGRILPYYANSHTEASYCGAFATKVRAQARGIIHRYVGADEQTKVIFAGSGATAGINKLVLLLRVAEKIAGGRRVTVFTGPYEHHSNILPWRESGAEVVEIAESDSGGPDLEMLTEALRSRSDDTFKIGAFSAASNVTGIVTDADAVTKVLKSHGALAIWDYAGAAPYLPMTMKTGSDCAKDAIVFSPHKFPGGPGASGVLVLREEIADASQPTAPGGGSVTFVSPWSHAYSASLCAREEAGTPNILADIRAALAVIVKEALGQDFIDRRNRALRDRALTVWQDNPHIQLLGKACHDALPIFSFRVRDGAGNYIHHQLFTRMLSDIYGIQARGGCACAGPYAHRLLEIGRQESAEILAAIAVGREMEKPGWVRLNLSYLLTDEKAGRIINAVDRLAHEVEVYVGQYMADPATARFRHKSATEPLAS